MPCDHDTYFRVADNEIVVSKMPNAELPVIASKWGHAAGGPVGDPADVEFVDRSLAELLATPVG